MHVLKLKLMQHWTCTQNERFHRLSDIIGLRKGLTPYSYVECNLCWLTTTFLSDRKDFERNFAPFQSVTNAWHFLLAQRWTGYCWSRAELKKTAVADCQSGYRVSTARSAPSEAFPFGLISSSSSYTCSRAFRTKIHVIYRCNFYRNSKVCIVLSHNVL